MSQRIPEGAFAYYVGLGPSRSYEAVAEHFSASKQGIVNLAQRENWQERIADIERKAQQSVEQQAQESLEAVNSRHLRTAQVLLRKGLELLKDRQLTPQLALRAIEVGVKLERDIRGISVERTEAATFTLPHIETAADVGKAFAALLQAVSSGEVSPENADRIGKLLELHRRAIETADLETRLQKLEDANSEVHP